MLQSEISIQMDEDKERKEWQEHRLKIAQEGKEFIFSQYEVKDVSDLIYFEKKYNSEFSLLDNDSCGDDWLDFNEGNLSFLCHRPFFENKENYKAFQKKYNKYGLTDLESIVILSYLQQCSAMYRMDGYVLGIPPFAVKLNNILQNALAKFPSSKEKVLIRQLNNYDKKDFKVGETYQPSYSLTTSANPEWNDGSWNQYIITTLSEDTTTARIIPGSSDYEKQVTFLVGAKFLITNIENDAKKGHRIYMEETI